MPVVPPSVGALLSHLGKAPMPVNVTPAEIKAVLHSQGKMWNIPESLLKQICTALNTGSHLILSGPPGTGKTTLATAVALAAQGQVPIVTTATADWTSFDTVGGYMPDPIGSAPNALRFEPGVLLQSLAERRWIIVDEINRAQIDKAIGQLFTVLAGGEVLLPYRSTSGSRIQIKASNGISNSDVYYKTDDWRVIATMNEYDKDALFEMSYAFMRRFAVVRVGLPDNYGDWVANAAAGLPPDIVNSLRALADASAQLEMRELGPAIFENVINYLKERSTLDNESKQHYAEAIALYILPQFQGLDHHEIRPLWQKVKPVISGANSAKAYLDVNMKALTSYSLDYLDTSP